MLTTMSRQIRTVVASLSEHYPQRPATLAEPPPGSNLAPVMGQFGPPVIGYSVSAINGHLSFSRALTNRYGDILWFGLMGRKVVIVVGPEMTEELLLDRDHVFSAKDGYDFMIGPFFKKGLLLRDFEDHLYHRRIMQKAFTRQRLAGYLELTNPHIERTLSRWKPRPDFHAYTKVKQLLLDLAAEVFMGTELGSEARRLNQAFEEAVAGGQAIVRTNVPGGMWARGLHGRKLLEEYFRRELPAKRAGSGTDLFSALCHIESDEGHTFTDDDIVNHMIFLMMAAHDTTALTTSMMLFHLGKYPEWQDRLRSQSQALGKASLEFEDVDKLPDLDLVFKETLRLYAPVGQNLRQATRDTQLGGHYIPEGTLVVASPYASMRQRPWHHPDEFDPERFTSERQENNVHRFAWFPFGGGVHKCIGMYFGGMQAKSIVHHMLLNFRWSVDKDYFPPLGWGTGPTPEDGLPIRLERLPN